MVTQEGLDSYKGGSSNGIVSKPIKGQKTERSFIVMKITYDCPLKMN